MGGVLSYFWTPEPIPDNSELETFHCSPASRTYVPLKTNRPLKRKRKLFEYRDPRIIRPMTYREILKAQGPSVRKNS